MTIADFSNIPSPGICPYPQWAHLLREALVSLGCGYSNFRVVPSGTLTADFFDAFPDGCTDVPAVVIRDEATPELWYWNPNTAAWVQVTTSSAAAGTVTIPVTAAYINDVQYPFSYGSRNRVSWNNIVLNETAHGTFNGNRFTAVQAGRYRISAGYSLRLFGTSIFPQVGNPSLLNELDIYRNPVNFDHREKVNLVQHYVGYGNSNTLFVVNLGTGAPQPGLSVNVMLPEDSVQSYPGAWYSIGCVAEGTAHLEIGDYIECWVRSQLTNMTGSISWGIGGSNLRRREYFIVERVR